MTNGLVSVVIPTYKRGEMLPRAIQSVLNQTYKNIEVLVVDDNIPGDAFSEDVRKLVESYNDNRVRYVGQKEHINGAKARNEGIKASRGEFVAFLDDDDEWLKNKIEKQMAMLSKNPNCGGISCLYDVYVGDKCVRHCKPYNSENLQFQIFCREVAVFTPTVLIKKEVLDNMRCFDISLKRHQDLQFLIDVLNVTDMCVLPETLVIVHDDSPINKPNSSNIIEIKRLFFASVHDTFMKYSSKEQRLIRNAHYFEIVLMAIREKKIFRAVKYLLKVGISPSSYAMLLKRYRSRK